MLNMPQAAVAEYRDRGYTVVPGVTGSRDLEELRAECDRLVAACLADDRNEWRLQWETDFLADADRGGMDRKIRMIWPVLDFSPAFAALAFRHEVTRVPGAIFGDDVEVFEDKLNLKQAGGSGFEWHQDWNCCWRAHTDELVTCFVSLDDADLSNGCLRVVPCSHAGKRIYPFRAGSTFEIDNHVIDHDAVTPVELKAGDMLVFDPYLLHFSDVNRSARQRRTIIYTYNPLRLGRLSNHPARAPKELVPVLGRSYRPFTD